MNSLLTQSNKYNLTLTTSSIQLHSNHFSQNHRSEKRLQNMRNKQLLTSTEIFKSNKPKPVMFSNKQNAISYSSSVKNTDESLKDTPNPNNCNICHNKKAFLSKQTKLKTSICESQKQLDTGLHLNKMNENVGKKVKQVSIDLQNKYNRIFHKKTYTKNKRKESCEVEVGGCISPMPYEGGAGICQEGFVSMNSSLKKQRSCYGRLVKRSLSRPMLNTNGNKEGGLKNKKDSKKKFQFKPRSNTYYIKSNNYLNSNSNAGTKHDNKMDSNINTNTTTAPQSQVFSSISTLQTLFKITELEPKQITSHEQIKELEELNHKLNLINSNNINTNINNTNNNNNIISTPSILQPLHNSKCNIINAEMLETSSLNNTPHMINEDVYISSNNRLQTYKLLLDCITNKFSEIQDIVHNDINSKFIYGNQMSDNKSINRMSELHSKIEFTQDNIPKQTSKHTIKGNVYDIDDNEMEEKTNVIIPEGGHSKTEPNEIYDMKEMNEDSFLQYKVNDDIMEPTMSMNSDLGKTFLEVNYEGGGCNEGNYYSNNNENIVSFLSNYQNEIKSFLQQNGNANNKEGIDITNNNNYNNTSEFSDVIINNTNDTITTITQSNQNLLKKIDSPHHNIENHKVNNNEDNKCFIY